jgi:hypothetical protein
MREALRVRIMAGGPAAHVVGILTGQLAYIRGRRESFAEADTLFARSFRILGRILPDDHADVRRTHELAAEISDLSGDPARASEHRTRAAVR